MKLTGQFLYKVTSGRLKIGPRIFVAGDEVPLTINQAVSLYETGQIQYIRTLGNRGRRYRKVAPGEKLAKLPMCEMARLPVKELREMAKREFGIVDRGLKAKEIIRTIYNIRERSRYGLLCAN